MNEVRRYRVLETLGKGGFGTVYRAELLGSGGFAKQVALKVLNDEGQREIALRLRDEARILGLLHHRAVVGVDNLVRLDPGWAVVMEYVAGVDATSLIRYGPAPVRVVLEIIEEVASALHAAYSQPSEMTGKPLYLIHRDIKPSNIRITPRGEVKILDFGVAQASFKTREARTRATLFGSFQYMAPERLDGIDGPKGDIYALGLVMARLLTSARFPEPPKHPRRHTTFVELVHARSKEGLADAAAHVTPEAQEAILNLVTSMVAFEPADRPTARDVERFCREWRSPLGGPWLRDWAEHEVPRLSARLGPPPNEDPLSGSILTELAGTDELPAQIPHEDETSETVAVGPWELAVLEASLEDSRWQAPQPSDLRPPTVRAIDSPPPEPARPAEPPPSTSADTPVRIEQRRGAALRDVTPPPLLGVPAVLPDIEDDEGPTQYIGSQTRGRTLPRPTAQAWSPQPDKPVVKPPVVEQRPAPPRGPIPLDFPTAEIPKPGLPSPALLQAALDPSDLPVPPPTAPVEDLPEPRMVAPRTNDAAELPTVASSLLAAALEEATAETQAVQRADLLENLETLPASQPAPAVEAATLEVRPAAEETLEVSLSAPTVAAPLASRAEPVVAPSVAIPTRAEPTARGATPIPTVQPLRPQPPTPPAGLRSTRAPVAEVRDPAPMRSPTASAAASTNVDTEELPIKRNNATLAFVVTVGVILLLLLVGLALRRGDTPTEPPAPTPTPADAAGTQEPSAAPPPAAPPEAPASAPPEAQTPPPSAPATPPPAVSPTPSTPATASSTKAPTSASTRTTPSSTARTSPSASDTTSPWTISAASSAPYPPPLTVVTDTPPKEVVVSTPEPEPAATAAGGQGVVRITGEATDAWLVGSNGQRYGSGSVPAGTYNLKAIFGEGTEVSAGRVDVQAGETVTLKCIGAFRQCRKI